MKSASIGPIEIVASGVAAAAEPDETRAAAHAARTTRATAVRTAASLSWAA